MVDRIVAPDRVIQAKGSELLWPLLNKASDGAERAENAAADAQAAGRYFPTRQAGEAATPIDQRFSTDESGVLVSYRRTAGGSVEISRSLTPASLAAADGAERVGFNQGAPFIQTRKALDKLREVGASVADTGASGLIEDDATDAVQEIVDHFAATGGAWYWPDGLFRTTRPLVWDVSKPQRVTGQGQRPVYPGGLRS